MSGNAILNATPVNKEDYKQVIAILKEYLPNGLSIYPFGSAGKKNISGDIDLFIDSEELKLLFPSLSLLESRKLLQSYFINQGLTSTRSGIAVHVGIPFNGNVIQVDLMAINNPTIIQKLHDHTYTNDSVTGKTIVSMWCDMANLTSPTYMISPYIGLLDRNTKQLISNDKAVIAKLILNDDATSDDMCSPNSIIQAVSNNPVKLKHLNNTYNTNL